MLLYPETKSTAFDLIKQQQLSVTSKYPQQSSNSLKFSIASLLFNNNSNNLLPQTVSSETCNQQLKHYFINNNTSNQFNKFFDQSDVSSTNHQLTNNKICSEKSFCKDYFCAKYSTEKSSTSVNSNFTCLNSNVASLNNNNISTLELNTCDSNSLNVVDDDSLLDEILNQNNLPQSNCAQDSLGNSCSTNGSTMLTCSQNQNFDKKVVLRAMIMNMNKNELTSNFFLNKKLCKLTNQFYQQSQQCLVNNKTSSNSLDQQASQFNNESNNANFSQNVPVNLNKNFYLNETSKLTLSNNSKICSSETKLNSSSIGSKKKRIRTIFSPEQLEVLEYHFRQKAYMVGHERFYLASSLNLSEAQVKVWFQNRRIKSRKFEVEKKNLF